MTPLIFEWIVLLFFVGFCAVMALAVLTIGCLAAFLPLAFLYFWITEGWNQAVKETQFWK